jgi:hypothetical protein
MATASSDEWSVEVGVYVRGMCVQRCQIRVVGFESGQMRRLASWGAN